MKPDFLCYNVLIDGLPKKGEHGKGMGIWERLLTDGEVKPNVVTYNAVLSELCRIVRFEEVMEMWSRMVMNGYQSDLLILIRGLSEMGNVVGLRGFKDGQDRVWS